MESGRQKVYWQKDPPVPGAQAVPAGHVQTSLKDASLQVAPAPPQVLIFCCFQQLHIMGNDGTWARV